MSGMGYVDAPDLVNDDVPVAPPTDDERARAVACVCSRALDVPDARLLLDMLGLLP
jgi:hypothetical protein